MTESPLLEPETVAQKYDTTLKALFEAEAAQIIPTLLAEANLFGEIELLGEIELEEEQNVELDRTRIRADLVYRVLHQGQPAISHMELQTGADKDIILRLLEYHGLLHAKYKIPVISTIIYPFKTSVPTSLYYEKDGDTTLLILHFKVICLWKRDAAHYVKNRILYMYTLLPAMQGATVPLLKQALKEMAEYYSREQLSHHLPRFHSIMQRSDTMTEDEKRAIEEELYMHYQYDEFIDGNPAVRARLLKQDLESKARGIAEGELKGKLEGIAEGELKGKLEGIRTAIETIVSVHFPALRMPAAQAAQRLHDPEELDQLLRALVTAPNEQAAHLLLKQSE